MALATTDYLPLAEKFLQHWSDAENALGKALVLEDGTTQDMLQSLKDALSSAQGTITTSENDRQGAIGQRDSARAEALPIARQVRKGILGVVPSSDEARQLPATLPSLTEDVQKQLVALRDIENVWTRVNALPAGSYPSLTLPFTVLVDLGGTEDLVTLTRYSAAVQALSAAATTLKTAEQALNQAKQNRKKSVEDLQKVFLAYRKRIRGTFPRTSALYRSLP
ncbi:hypothetical protein [Armatimonas sp.]|uniref:hypothetical protein n=1 Tax=Armatimonas sp. TaxID=1872638 RepID=UPI003752E65D